MMGIPSSLMMEPIELTGLGLIVELTSAKTSLLKTLTERSSSTGSNYSLLGQGHLLKMSKDMRGDLIFFDKNIIL